MSSIQFVESVTPQLAKRTTHWYAIQTRAKHEKKVATELRETGMEVFLPMLTEIRQWSDRRMSVEVPLFSCYLFVNVDSSAEARISILRAAGVLRFVGGHHEEAAIPDRDIENINLLLAKKVPFVSQGFFPAGIDGGLPGQLFHIQNQLSLGPYTTGTTDFGFGNRAAITKTGAVNPLQNGITIFPGGAPLYKNGVLVGAVGVSGDGVDQDDITTFGSVIP